MQVRTPFLRAIGNSNQMKTHKLIQNFVNLGKLGNLETHLCCLSFPCFVQGIRSEELVAPLFLLEYTFISACFA